MLSDNFDEIPFFNLPKGRSTQGYIEQLIGFLEAYLPNFKNFYKPNSFINESEEQITYHLCRYLGQIKRHNPEGVDYPFEFFQETPQRQKIKKGHTRKADVGVHINAFDTSMDLIYCIEAKRLPTDKVNGVREKEYIVGNYGGINRFKKNLHGISIEGDQLPHNGMIAYVQANSFLYWHLTLNGWIGTETTWGDEEILYSIYDNGKISKLESNHLRDGGGQLKLTHLWLMME